MTLACVLEVPGNFLLAAIDSADGPVDLRAAEQLQAGGGIVAGVVDLG